LKNDRLVQDLEVNMLCEDIQMVRRDALLVNYVKQFVLLKQLLLKLNLVKMVLEEQLDTTSTC